MTGLLKIATPISSLFADTQSAQEILACSDCLECRDHSPQADWPRQELFHTDIQPIHPISEEEWDYLRKIREAKPGLKLLSMHMASCCDQPVLRGGRFEPGGKTYGKNELLARARENLAGIRKLFGSQVELAVENNNYYPTPAYQCVCDAGFISEIVRENRLRFLFDVAHAHITSINQGVDYEEYRRQLPLEALVQVHLCRHGINGNGQAYDAHELPGHAEFCEVEELANRHPFNYLTIEYYKDANGLVSALREASKIKNEIAGATV